MPTVSRGVYRWLLQTPATVEDFADRLNHFWTFSLLLILACVISWKQNYGDPIQCWCPAQFTDTMVRHTESVCWNSQNIQYKENILKAMVSMNLTVDDVIPRLNDPSPIVSSSFNNLTPLQEASTTTTLYQYLPLILCFQALLFKLPNILLYVLHGLSGISFDKIYGLTLGYENMSLEERTSVGRQISRYILRWCKQCEGCLPWRLLTLLWLCVKILYCVNIIVQLCVLNNYLVQEYPVNENNVTSFGEVISDNLFDNNGSLWKESPVLPKQIYCDFKIRHFRNIHEYTVVCHLPANHFNERVYMYLWAWFVFVAVVTCVSLAFWLMTTLLPLSRKRYIERAMSTMEDFNMTQFSPVNFDKFCDVIGEDGVMVLKLTAANSSEFVVRDVVYNMFRQYAGKDGSDMMETGVVPLTAPPACQGSTSCPEKPSCPEKMYPDV